MRTIGLEIPENPESRQKKKGSESQHDDSLR